MEAATAEDLLAMLSQGVRSGRGRCREYFTPTALPAHRWPPTAWHEPRRSGSALPRQRREQVIPTTGNALLLL